MGLNVSNTYTIVAKRNMVSIFQVDLANELRGSSLIQHQYMGRGGFPRDKYAQFIVIKRSSFFMDQLKFFTFITSSVFTSFVLRNPENLIMSPMFAFTYLLQSKSHCIALSQPDQPGCIRIDIDWRLVGLSRLTGQSSSSPASAGVPSTIHHLRTTLTA